MSFGIYELLLPLVALIALVIIGIVLLVKGRKNPENKGVGAVFIIFGGIGLILYLYFLASGGFSRPLPHRCIFSPEIACLEHRLSDGELSFRLRNLLDSSAGFEFNAIDIAEESNITCAVYPATVEPGKIMDVICAFDKPFTKGYKVKFEILGTYTITDIPGTVQGEIYTEAK